MINNKMLHDEIVRIKTEPPGSNHQASMKLREMLVSIINRELEKRKQQIPDYIDKTKLRDYMLMFSAEHWKNFDPSKSQNPVAFFVQCAWGNICWFVAHEKHKKFPTERNLNCSYERAMRVVKGSKFNS